MKNIRKDLIEQELQNSKDFKYFKLSNRFIDWLFNHYYCNEVCENFYDMETDNEEIRITFLTWQEPFFDGNWGMTQKYVNNVARKLLKKRIRNYTDLKKRLFVRIDKDDIVIYFYGRDIIECDYWLTFLRKKK